MDNMDHVNGTSAEGSKGLNLDRDSSIFIGMQQCILRDHYMIIPKNVQYFLLGGG